MATSRLISMHIGKGKTIAKSISNRTDYAGNPDKTRGGELVSSYECAPETVDAEFLLSKRQYKAITGREQKRGNDVLAYQIRQSFKPGEITPERANEIGYKLAMQFTKGRHAFIVATHEDKAHIHSHIIFNSTSLDCSRKFRDFLGSGRAVQRLSDRLCLENGLSIVEEPKLGGKHYGKWLGDKKPLSFQGQLRQTIDSILTEKPTSFEDFLQKMERAGYEVKTGKLVKLRTQGQKNYTKLRSLGDGYSENDIRQIIEGVKPHRAEKVPAKVNLLVDIQAKLNAGKGAGYEQWAKTFNLKQTAQTLNFLQDNSLLEYDNLAAKAEKATTLYNDLSSKIKGLEHHMDRTAKLKKHIINYSKTREIYVAYRKAGYSKKFYDAHAGDIILHKAAKAAFEEMDVKKLPTIKNLQAEYECLLSEKKKVYKLYAKARSEMRELLNAKANVDRLLNVQQEHEPQHMDKEKGR